MEVVNKALESRINKLMDLAFELQNIPVAIVDTEEVMPLRKLGINVSEYVDDNISAQEGVDVDFEYIDEIFKVKNISGVLMTLVDIKSFENLSKEKIVSYIYSLDNLKQLLMGSIKDYVEEHTPEEQSKELMVVEEKKGELVQRNNDTSPTSMFGKGFMDDYFFQQLMQSVGSDPLLSIALMQKKEEGKLTKEVVMKLMSMMPSGFHRGGMSNIFVMNYIQNL